MHVVGPRRARPARFGDGLRVLRRLVEDARAAMAAIGQEPASLGPQRDPDGRALQSTVQTGPRTPGRLRARTSRHLQRAEDPQDTTPPAPDEPGTGPDRSDGSDGAAVEDGHAESWRLVQLAQRGDGEAFGVLYDRYVDLVFRFIYYKVNDRTLAEDFTSETFLRALRRLSTFSYQGRDIGAWFVTIARNIVLDHVKSARTRLESTTGDAIEVVDRHERVQSTESAVLDSLQSEHLMAAVNQLGDEQRECIVLRFVQGMSVSETAEIMGKNDGAIKALQHRAVRKLAGLVGDGLR